MCDRIGCTHLPDLEAMDFSRRSFVKSTGAAVLTMGLGSSLFGSAAHAAGELKSTHGTGFAISTSSSPTPCSSPRRTGWSSSSSTRRRSPSR